jgi:trk system potassium uptake protein TrkA
MNIIILGAGQVGGSVAHKLAGEDNKVTVVDIDQARLQALQDELDIRTVVGHASSPEVLAEAGAANADLLLAATSSDDTNMMACQVAHQLFHVATKIARVRSPDYLAYPQLFASNAVPVDVLISPEQLVTRYVRLLVEYPTALAVHEFADGRVVLMEIRATASGHMTTMPLRSLYARLPGVAVRAVALYRNDQRVPIGDDTRVQADDEVLLVTTPEHIHRVAAEFRDIELPTRRVMIAGGGNIGRQLAQGLEQQMSVKIIEFNRARATLLAETLSSAVVLHGDATDKKMLMDEDIDDVDVFCALTNDDEDNIMAALLAKRLGARRVIALINRPTYVELMEESAIDVVMSPQLITIGAILPHVRRGDVVVARALRDGAAEALEAVAHGDARTSKVVGRKVADVELPVSACIAALVRNGALLLPEPDTVIANDDHVIVYLADKERLRELERLFQVSVLYV